MRNALWRRARAGALVVTTLALAGAGLSACGNTDPAAPAVGLGLVVGLHANGAVVPASELQAAIPERLPGGSSVVIIGVDGSADGVPIYDKSIKVPEDPSAADPLAPEEDAAKVRGRLKAKYEAARPDTSQSDPYAAIARAALGIRGVDGPRKIVIFDSMLSTAGLLQLQHLGLDGSAEDLWGSIAQSDNIPDLTGIDIEVHGLGQTSHPQQPLNEARRKALEGLTRYVLTQAGASSVSFTYPALSEVSASGLPKVSTVDVRDPQPEPKPVKAKKCEPYVVRQTRIQFAGDSAEFVDPARAADIADDVAAALQKCPGTLLVTGTTSSWGTEDGRKAVSLARAKAFRSVLAKAMDVEPSSIDVRGAGNDFPERVKDRRGDGSLDPARAAQNRTVRISVSAD